MILTAAIILFSLLHLTPVWAPNWRKVIAARLGDGPVKGLIALGLLASVYLMTVGWAQLGAGTPLYDLGPAAKHANLVFTLLAFLLFALSQGPTLTHMLIRNQQLTAVKLWATGHLLANGDARSLILFGGLLIWAVLMVIGIKKRRGAWVKPTEWSLPRTMAGVILGCAIWYGIALYHSSLFGVYVLPY